MLGLGIGLTSPSVLGGASLLGQMFLDGSNDSIGEGNATLNSLLSIANDFSFSCKFKYASLPGSGESYILNSDFGTNDRVCIGYDADLTTTFSVRFDNGSSIKVGDTTFSDTASYHNLAVTWDNAGTLRAWLDNVELTAGGLGSMTYGTSGTGQFWIGAGNTGDNFHGHLANIRFWNSTLGAVEAASISNGGAPTTARTHEYIGDATVGTTTVIDSAGSNNLTANNVDTDTFWV